MAAMCSLDSLSMQAANCYLGLTSSGVQKNIMHDFLFKTGIYSLGCLGGRGRPFVTARRDWGLGNQISSYICSKIIMYSAIFF